MELLQIATAQFITKREGQLLQIATAFLLQSAIRLFTNCDRYYKVRQIYYNCERCYKVRSLLQDYVSRPLPTTHDPRHLATCTLNTCPLTRDSIKSFRRVQKWDHFTMVETNIELKYGEYNLWSFVFVAVRPVRRNQHKNRVVFVCLCSDCIV